MIRKGHKVYEEEDFDKIDMKMSNRALFIKMVQTMKRHNRLIDALIMYQVEVSALRRKVEYYKKRVEMLNGGGNYHTFTNIDKNLRRKQK